MYKPSGTHTHATPCDNLCDVQKIQTAQCARNMYNRRNVQKVQSAQCARNTIDGRFKYQQEHNNGRDPLRGLPTSSDGHATCD